MAKFATDAIGAMLLSSLVQVTESISGSVVPLAMFCSLLVTAFLKLHKYFVRNTLTLLWQSR